MSSSSNSSAAASPEESKNNSPPSSDNSSPPPSSPDSPPPPSSDDSPPSDQSPPPQSSSSPPPPSSDDSSSSPPPPPSSNDNNGGGGSSSGNSSPPSPKSSSGSSSDNTPSPPSSNHTPSSSSSSSSPGALAPPKSSDSSSDHTSQIVIGTAVGGSLLLLMFILCCIAFRCGKKKKRKHEAMNYYGGPPQGGMMYSGEYYPSSQQQQQQHHPSQWQSGDHIVKLNPPPGGMGGGWPAPPPPPPMMSSGEMSGNYSGPRQHPLPPPSPSMALGFNQSTFTYDDLAAATGGFAHSNLLGQGGFGYVHKGVLPTGKEVAVKSLKTGSGQGEREFQAEVEIISRVHHRHLVSLVGYCIAGGQRMLVYEFVPNKTLEYHLHGEGRPVMDWPSRLRIALGSAKGLAYLHEDCHPRIIHRDIKAANILIDHNFEAMVADFGLAKLSNDTNTHVSTRVMGTFGYLAPEYAASGKLTEKSDVFSFGIMLLELITGKRPIDNTSDEDSLVDWARPILARALEDGNYYEIVDPRLGNNYDRQEMGRLIACAAASIRHSARRRPKMSQIARALEGDMSLDALNEAGKTTGQSSTYDTKAYNNDMEKFRKTAFASAEFSGEYSGSTGEFGNRTSSSSGEMGHSKPRGF
uniref:non-specific serine/threonine protein kinase n=1 Tax=Kalanchoe fedtschenkoi TaxID=63787 RepID=A0A7N0ZSU5_KALFE